VTAPASFLGTAPAAPQALGDDPAAQQRAPASSWYALAVLVLVMVLSLVDKLSGGLALEDLVVIECVQALCCRPQCPNWVEGRDCVHMSHPV